MIRSYRTAMDIERPEDTTEADGQDFIDFWGRALRSDLFADINGFQPSDGSTLAPKAARWFRDAWSRAGVREQRFTVKRFTVQFFDLTGQQGDMVAEVDVLAGTWWTA